MNDMVEASIIAGKTHLSMRRPARFSLDLKDENASDKEKIEGAELYLAINCKHHTNTARSYIMAEILAFAQEMGYRRVIKDRCLLSKTVYELVPR